MRVLISAYVCRPGAGSEPGAGWAFVRAAARAHAVTVVTRPENVEPVGSALAAEGLGAAAIVGVQTPRWLRRFEGRMGLGHLDYLVWQVRARPVVRAIASRVDVAHHVTYGNDWLPCALHFEPRVPLVWGPVGGTAPIPWRLARFMSPHGFARELAREALTRPIRALTARVVRRRGGVVVAVNPETARRFAAEGATVVVEPHVALPGAPAAPITARPTAAGGARQAVFVARLSSWKGPYLALHALALLPPVWRLDVYGTGSEEAGLRRRARRLGVAERVRFLGHRPPHEIAAALERADVLLFPSMHDAAPFAVAEAVRLGCPVACLDVGGPPLLIGEAGGIAVPADSLAPQRLAEAVAALRRRAPTDRWNADRLTARVSEWYARAAGPDARDGARPRVAAPCA